MILQQSCEELHHKLLRSSSLPLRVKSAFVATMSNPFLDHHQEKSLLQIVSSYAAHYERQLSSELSFFPVYSTLPSLSNSSLWGVLFTFQSNSIQHQIEQEDWHPLVKEELPDFFPVPHLNLSCFIKDAAFSACYFTLCAYQGELSAEEQKTHKKKLEMLLFSCLHQKEAKSFSSCGEEAFTKQFLYSLKNEVHPDHPAPDVMISFDRKKGELIAYRIGIAWPEQKGKTVQDIFSTLTDVFPPTCRIERLYSHNFQGEKCCVDALSCLIELTKEEYQSDEGRDDIERGYHYIKKRLKSGLGEYRNYTGTMNDYRLRTYSNFLEAIACHKTYHSKAVNARLAQDFFASITLFDHITLLKDELISLFLIYQYLIQKPPPVNNSYHIEEKKEQNYLAMGIVATNPSFKRFVQDYISPLTQTEGLRPCFISLDHVNCSFWGCIFSNRKKLTSLQQKVHAALKQWQEKEQSRQILRLNCEFPFETILPFKSGPNDYMLQHLLFEGLMHIDRQGQLQPALAKSVKINEERTRYLLTLKKAHWSNGAAITASDWIASWKQTVEKAFPNRDLETMRRIKNMTLFQQGKVSWQKVGVTALTEDQLEVLLEQPTPYFLELLALPIYFLLPEKLRGPILYCDVKDPVSGPFQLSNGIDDSKLCLVKNNQYWNADAITLEQVVITREQNDQKISQQYRNGNLHWVGLARSNTLALRQKEQRSSCSVVPLLYRCHVNVNQFPFNHLKIRQALAQSINRNQIIDCFPTEYQLRPAFSPVPRLSLHPFTDQVDAKELWKEGMEELQLSAYPAICKIAYSPKNRLAEITAQQLKIQWEYSFPLQIQLCPITTSQFYSESLHEFTCLVGAYTSIISHPLFSLDEFTDQEHYLNYAKWQHPLYQKFVDAAYKTDKKEQCDALCQQAATLLMQQAPIIPLFYHENGYIFSSQLKNITASFFNTGFRYAVIQP